MGSTGLEPLATIHNQAEMLEALRTARVMRGLSNEVSEELGGLARGHVDKVLGPTGAKGLSAMLFDTLTAVFAVKFVMVRDLEAEALMEPKWERRDLSNVRSYHPRVGKHVLERARPALLQEFGAKLALAFGDELDQVVAGMAGARAAPLPALLPPESPLSTKTLESSQPERAPRARLHVVGGAV